MDDHFLLQTVFSCQSIGSRLFCLVRKSSVHRGVMECQYPYSKHYGVDEGSAHHGRADAFVLPKQPSHCPGGSKFAEMTSSRIMVALI